MKTMKTITRFVMIVLLAVGMQTFVVHAATQCSAASITSDSCYVTYCSGNAGNDSASCNTYAQTVVNRDDGGDATCKSIDDNNEASCCNNDANPSPMCQAYQTYTAADAQQENGGGGLNSGSNGGSGSGSGGLNSGSNSSQSVNQPLNIHLINPLSGVSTIPDAINKILSVVIRIALPLIIIMFIWSGMTFIFARGNPTETARARRMFLYTVIGTLLILGAWTITNALVGTVNSIIS